MRIIITQLVILTLSLLLVNATDDQYCSNLFMEFKSKCPISEINLHSDSCCDLRSFLTSGVYKINKGAFDSYARVYCDMETHGGGWIVIQRNKKNSLVNFNRNWTDYEKGFGDLTTEFWYGLEEMHCLTQKGQWEMRVDVLLNNNTWSYLHYTQFSVGNASEQYRLTVGGFIGKEHNWFAYHNGRRFSTPDRNDLHRCAAGYKSGWWYGSCFHININRQPPYEGTRGQALFTEMKIRPKDCIIQ